MAELDLWSLERSCLERDLSPVCGCDEAGAGPLAGPVYAAAVILPLGVEIQGLNDSKKLTEKKREALFPVIQEQATAWAVARVRYRSLDQTASTGTPENRASRALICFQPFSVTRASYQPWIRR